MLLLSLTVVSFALIPTIPIHFGVSEQSSWRLLCGVYAAAWIAYLIYMANTTRKSQFGIGFADLTLVNRFNSLVVHPAAVLVLILGAVGFWRDSTSSVYISALLLMLLLSSFLFLQTVSHIIRTEDDQ